MRFILPIPTLLSCLVLAAHFLRSGQLVLTLISCAMPWFLAIRRTWATRLVQVLLVVGAAEWIRTMLTIAAERQAEGRPWIRMAVILASVALWSLMAAAALAWWSPRRAIDANCRRAQAQTQ